MKPNSEFEKEFEMGSQSLKEKNYINAEFHFRNAHQFGHDVKKDHLRTHAKMIKLGWMKKSPSTVLSQCALYLLAAIFERNPN